MQDKMKICIVFVVVINAIRVDTTEMKFGYRIKEGLARFKEDVDVDLDNNVVQFHVPNHNDVLESYIIQDFNKKKQIMCYPALQQCRLRDITDLAMRMNAGAVAESFLKSWNDGVNSISHDNAVVTEDLYYVNGEEVENTVSLGDKMRQFYEKFGFPLLKEMKVPENATLVKIKETVGKRAKRYVSLTEIDCGGQTAKLLYGVSNGKGCNYIRLCSVKEPGSSNLIPTGSCPSQHLTTLMAYMCWCCPSVDTSRPVDPNGSSCRCNKM